MSEPTTTPQTVRFEEHECLGVECSQCGPATHIERVFIHLRTARVCAACRCGNLILALQVGLEGYAQAVGLKLDQIEPSRIVKPFMVPRTEN